MNRNPMEHSMPVASITRYESAILAAYRALSKARLEASLNGLEGEQEDLSELQREIWRMVETASNAKRRRLRR